MVYIILDSACFVTCFFEFFLKLRGLGFKVVQYEKQLNFKAIEISVWPTLWDSFYFATVKPFLLYGGIGRLKSWQQMIKLRFCNADHGFYNTILS